MSILSYRGTIAGELQPQLQRLPQRHQPILIRLLPSRPVSAVIATAATSAVGKRPRRCWSRPLGIPMVWMEMGMGMEWLARVCG